MEAKNTYMNLFKTDGQIMKETKKEQGETQYIYDQVMADKFPKMYCQKSKYESVWDRNVRPREDALKIQNAPLTTSQVIGWREPIDNMQTGFNREAVCKRTFFDVGHL